MLELATKAGRKDLERQWKALRRGLYLGGDSFLEKLEELLGPALQGCRRDSFSHQSRQAHDIAAAKHALAEGMKALELKEAQLLNLPKGAPTPPWIMPIAGHHLS